MEEVRNMKKILMIALMALTGVVNAGEELRSKVWIPATEVMAGDYLTKPNGTAIGPTVDTKPWLRKSLSGTALVLVDVADNTCSAVVFTMLVPNDYRDGAKLYALLSPDASDTTFKLNSRVQNQGVFASEPTTVTTEVWGTATVALAAGDEDNLNYVEIVNGAFDTVRANQFINAYIFRDAGTGADVDLYGFVFEYKPHYFRNR